MDLMSFSLFLLNWICIFWTIDQYGFCNDDSEIWFSSLMNIWCTLLFIFIIILLLFNHFSCDFTDALQKLGSVRFVMKRMYSFIQKGCIKFIKSDSI